jgi:hypothetical protein
MSTRLYPFRGKNGRHESLAYVLLVVSSEFGTMYKENKIQLAETIGNKYNSNAVALIAYCLQY